MVQIGDATQAGKIVAEMPPFVWRLTGWLAHLPKSWGPLAGYIIMSYQFDYQSGRSWWASLVSGVRTWWDCRSVRKGRRWSK